jgi:transcriptional regulator with XRE-family HTH domain
MCLHGPMQTPRITNGRRIRQAREAIGLTQHQLAAKLGQDGHSVHQTTISRIEHGGSISASMRALLLAAFPGLELLDDPEDDEESAPTLDPRIVRDLPVYSARALATHLGVSMDSIIKAARRKELRGRKLGGRWFFTAEAVKDYLNGDQAPNDAAPAFTPVTRRRAS